MERDLLTTPQDIQKEFFAEALEEWGEFIPTRHHTDRIIPRTSGIFAFKFLGEHLRRGGVTEIPSLGITITEEHLSPEILEKD